MMPLWRTFQLRGGRWPLLVVALMMLANCVQSTTEGSSRGSTSRKRPGHPAHLPQVDPSTIGPGTVIELEDGDYQEALVLPFRGTAARPVVIKAAEGALPTFHQPVLLTGADHVRLEGIAVEGVASAGITIGKDSHDVTIAGCTVENCGLGIWITDGAGAGNVLERNTLRDNRTHGIAVDRVNATPGAETIIARNKISGNGHHGIELNGSWYIVEGNEVFENGAASPGTSGIHVFAKDAGQDAGDHNIIRYNVTYRNREEDGPDGNGIQLDQWCDRNEVYYNIAYENDGAGICLFDAAQSTVVNNTLFGNGQRPNRNRPHRAELLLAGDPHVDRTREIVVANNILVATAPEVFPLLVDRPTAAHPLSIEANLLFRAGGGDLYSWAGQTGADLQDLARLSSAKAHDNLAADPEFMIASPARPKDFQPRSGSPAVEAGNAAVPHGDRDVLGVPLRNVRRPDLGAVQSAP